MITAHVLVKNEENYIWYSVMSVIDEVDEILIWDTGSNDCTMEIVNELHKKYPTKITIKEIGGVDRNIYTSIRQQMLDSTKSGWIFILDGDEIWWRDAIKKVTEFIRHDGNEYESVVLPVINLVGDMFHYQEKNAGRYRFGNLYGHYSLKFINKDIPGLHVGEPYGKEGFFDIENKPIQERHKSKIKFLDYPIIHASHLRRSSKDFEVMQRSNKLKYEIGLGFPKDFYYPESFFLDRPINVPNIWVNMNSDFKLRAYIETPLRKIKRRILR